LVPGGEKLATITIIPKLGPHGSGPKYVGVDVNIVFSKSEQNNWNNTIDFLNRGFKVTVVEGEKPEVVPLPAEK
jgi:hypothetical protein